MSVKKLIGWMLLWGMMTTNGSEPELRGVWVAWAGTAVPSKTQIASVMDSLAHNGINTVLVDVWRYGYPYFPSQVFYDLTGKWSDEGNVKSRDVLEDMIAEAHRNRMEVEAWFEWGFAASVGSNNDLFKVRPEWFAENRSGRTEFSSSDGIVYQWLSHCHPEAQQFLLNLCREVVNRYDVDGIELDRIRYPQLDCGYDSATIALYKNEHNGSEPPQSGSDEEWRAWRAEKLTLFIKMIYDSLKAVNPKLHLSNAPVQYRYGYENFCQDWRPWINQGYLDYISPQVYWETAVMFKQELNGQLTHIADSSRCFPGLTTTANGRNVATDEVIEMIRYTRDRGLKGHVIWYHATLLDDLPALHEQVYQEPAAIPDRPEGWRLDPIIIQETDTHQVVFSSHWKDYSGIPGYQGGCRYTDVADSAWVEYRFEVPRNGWYEVYPFLITHYKAHPAAEYIIRHAGGTDTLTVDQSNTYRQRWFRLGDFYFETGQPAGLRITSRNLGARYLFTDALMLLNTNRPQDTVHTRIQEPDTGIGRTPCSSVSLRSINPNPADSRVNLEFQVDSPQFLIIRIYDISGRCVKQQPSQWYPIGNHTAGMDLTDIPCGIYLCRIAGNHGHSVRRLAVVR